MINPTYLILFCILIFFSCQNESQESIEEYDIVVYGANSAGVIAAYTAKTMGKFVLLIEPGKHLGGLTTGGLGYTDIGNKYAITGISRDFYRRLGEHYGKFEQWIFEPNVAKNLYQEYLDRAGLEVQFESRLVEVKKTDGLIQEITLGNNTDSDSQTSTIRGKMFIDATYEGDLMAMAGVSYTIGREPNSQYGET